MHEVFLSENKFFASQKKARKQIEKPTNDIEMQDVPLPSSGSNASLAGRNSLPSKFTPEQLKCLEDVKSLYLG